MPPLSLMVKVFPAQAGVILDITLFLIVKISIPRASGGDPWK